MEILSFKSDSISEERKRYQDALGDIQDNLMICLYNVQTQAFTYEKSFNDALKDNDINEGVLKDLPLEKQLEAVLTLGHTFFKHIRKKTDKTIDDDFEKYALLHDYISIPDNIDNKLSAKLIQVETFLKEVVFLLYPDKINSVNIYNERKKKFDQIEKINFKQKKYLLFGFLIIIILIGLGFYLLYHFLKKEKRR